jgi:hypothetical protein
VHNLVPKRPQGLDSDLVHICDRDASKYFERHESGLELAVLRQVAALQQRYPDDEMNRTHDEPNR